jgi:hypothetical protein
MSDGSTRSRGNPENALHGTYHQVSSRYRPQYLAEFCYCFSCRFDVAAMLSRRGYAATPCLCPTRCSSWPRLISNQVVAYILNIQLQALMVN